MKSFQYYIYTTLLFLIFSIFSNAQQQRLKKGGVFTYHTSHLLKTEELKRYKIDYEVLSVLHDGYKMEAKISLIDDFKRKFDNSSDKWKNVSQVYPELDPERYKYTYKNSLFTKDAVRFNVSLNGEINDVKIIDPSVGKDQIMDQVLITQFKEKYACPYLGDAKSLAKGDQLKFRTKTFCVDTVFADKIVLKAKVRKWAENKGEWQVKFNKIRQIEAEGYKLEIDKKTGLITEYNSCVRRERVVRVNSYEDYDCTFYNDQIKSDTTFLSPNVRLRGKLLNPKDGLDDIALVYKEEGALMPEIKTISTKMQPDSTFEFRLHLDDLHHYELLYQYRFPISLQPGDDVYMEVELKNEDLHCLNAQGVGVSSINFRNKINKSVKEISNRQGVLFQKSFNDVWSSCLKNPEQFNKNLEALGEGFETLYDSIQLHKEICSPELYLSVYWDLQTQVQDVNQGLNYFNNHLAARKKRIRERPGKPNNMFLTKMDEKIWNVNPVKKITSEFLQNPHPNNDLLRFSNNRRNIFFNFKQTTDSLLLETGRSNYQMSSKYEKHYRILYNNAENLYEGYSAYYIKYNIVKESFRNSPKTTYTNLYNRFCEEYANTDYASLLSGYIQTVEKVAPGKKAPNFEFKDLKGNIVKLSDFKGKGVYVDFAFNRHDYNFNKYGKPLEGIQSYLNNDDFVFIVVYVEDEKRNDMDLFQKIKSPVIKLVASREEAIDLAKQYYHSSLFHRAMINIDGEIVSRFAPRMIRLEESTNLLDKALVSNPKNIDFEGKIRILKIILGILGVLIFIGLIVWDRHLRRTKRKISEAAINTKVRELELTAIRAQMNPHFMYNCLNSIQNLVQKKQNDEAHQYLSKFAELIRSVLKNSEKEEISLATELEIIQNYVDLEKLRFDIDFNVEMDELVDDYSVFIPPLILQPLVENAILHGLAPKQGERKLAIKINKEQEDIICVAVTDNGVGRNAEHEKPKTSNGKGIKFSQERLDLLADKYGTAYHMQIEDLKDEQGKALGTKVQICFSEE